MPNLPRPKPLPSVKYDPPSNPPSRTLLGDISNASGQFSPFLNDAANGIYGALNQGGSYLFGGVPGKVARPVPPAVVSDPRDAGVVSATPTVTYDPVSGTQPDTGTSGTSPSNPLADRRYDALEESRMRQMAASNSQTDTARIQDAVNKNRANTQAAQAAGDNVNLARLNAEWERLTQSPLYQQMYGGSDANAMKQRLVNVYMKPGNPAAANDLAGAMSAAVADDVWAREATKAFGRPPNQLEWDEHWKAMNVGGRDPLEGHPQAIQNIKATMQGFSNNNQQTAYDDYSNWAGGH